MITRIIQGKKVQKTRKYIEKGENSVVITHISLDGDALSSSLGLYHFLPTYGRDNVAAVIPNAFSSFYKRMPSTKDVVTYEKYPDFAEKLIGEADVIFCLDFSEPRRIEELTPAVTASEGHRVMIDYHLDPADFCRVTMPCPEMFSISEMISRFIRRMGMLDLLGRDAAACIYTGMMTDTGSFTYNLSRLETHTIVGGLIKKGIDKDLIYRKVSQAYSECRLCMMGHVLYEKMRVYPGQQMAFITLSKEKLDRSQYQTRNTESFVNLSLSVESVSFSVFIRKDSDYIKMSLRSMGDFPCDQFASTYFNGGGYKNASGDEFYGSLSKTVTVLEKGSQEFDPNKSEDLGKHV